MFKKTLSVFLAILMAMSVCTLGFTAAAANIDYSIQYAELAEALQNNHVRTLTNYKIENTTLENGAEGFDTDANGFAYEHRVTASDDAEGSILRAANVFYYIAESLLSTTYGQGYYNPSLLLNQIIEKVKPQFAGNNEVYYEDFYGNRYEPTEEELEEYNYAVSLITANNAEVNERNLTQFRVYFIQKDCYSYYNVEAVLKYFMGNTTTINAGNWYHRYVFVVETSVDTAIKSIGNIGNYASTELVTRTGVFEWDYARSYNDLKTKAYYAFKKPSAETVWNNYGSEFGLSKTSTDLSETMDGDEGLTASGQAASFLLKEEIDTTTIAYLNLVYNSFSGMLISTTTTDSEGNTTLHSWDEKYKDYSDGMIKADSNNAVLAGYVADIASTFSNDTLHSMYGDQIGNIVNAAYILTPTDKMPTRTIYGKTISVTADTLDEIIYDMDGLVSPREGSDNVRDELVAGKVAEIVQLFFNTTNDLFKDTAVYGLEFESLQELVGLLVQGLLFRDNIVNLLVGLIYPLVVDLLEDKVYTAITDAVGSAISGLAEGLIENIITKNELAIYPSTLADLLMKDYPSKCSSGGVWNKAYQILKSHGKDWYVQSAEDEDYGTSDYKGNTDWVKTLDWGVDSSPISKKGDAFTDALCAGLGGFIRVVVTILCGDADYTDNVGLKYDNDQYNEYLDKYLVNILGVTGWLRSQGVYTKIVIPLFRILGLSEQNSYSGKSYGYVNSKLYHQLISNNGNYNYGNSLRLVIEPIVYWVTDVLGKKPFETLWKVLPNLVYFFTRQGYTGVEGKDLASYQSDWTDEEITDRTHGPFEVLQTYNLFDMLSSVFINITINVPILFNKKFQINVGSLASLINQNALFSSINGLLNSVLKLSFDDKSEGAPVEKLVAGYYDPDTLEVVPADSEEYQLNRDKYTEITLSYYTDPTESSYVLTEDEYHTVLVENLRYEQKEYRLPQIPEAKLISCGTVYTPWNTLTVEHPGVILLTVLRYVFTALGYKYNNSDETLPYLIECFGLKIDMEIFQGFNLKDIIYNIMLRPDDAIWSVLELFYSHEEGDYLTNKGYTYTIDPIRYHNATLLNTSINPTLTYGTKVRYTKYWTQEYATDVLSNADEFVKNILIMLGMTDFEDGIGAYLQKLLNENVFTDKIVNLLFNAIYQLLGGLNTTTGVDIETILNAALDVSYSTGSVAAALYNMCGESGAYEAIYHAESWTELFTVDYKEVEGETVPVTGDITLSWGVDDAAANDKAEVFCKTVSALLSPISFVIRYLLLDEDMDILSLVKLPAYAGYQYAVIGLLEALSCPDILTYKQYADKCNPEKDINADANTIYYILTPILGLLDEVYASPVDTLLTLLPNLLFVVSIGGVNDILNNLVHFAYVLLEVLSPIVDVYSILDGLLANIEVAGVSINLALPLDIDFNALASDLIGALVGNAIQINGVSISLPYIDFHTLCCGTLTSFASKELRTTVHLDAAGGGDMITALLRLVLDALFLDENEAAIAELVANAAESGKVDNYDKETIVMIVDELFTVMQTYEVPDMVLFALYFLINKLTPVSGTLATRFQATGMTIQSFFGSITDVNSFISNVSRLVGASSGTNADGTITDEETNTLTGFGSLIQRIKLFFEKIKMFFTNMFKK